MGMRGDIRSGPRPYLLESGQPGRPPNCQWLTHLPPAPTRRRQFHKAPKGRKSQMPIPPNSVTKFNLKVDRNGPDQCWPWLGSINRKGYGQFSAQIERKSETFEVHRLMWRLVNGPIPAGMLVCHSCDNPICVNPAHLWLGTSHDNNHDAIRKGRMKHNGRYCGTYWHKRDSRWRAQIKRDGKVISLGNFRTRDEAAAAVDAAKSIT